MVNKYDSLKKEKKQLMAIRNKLYEIEELDVALETYYHKFSPSDLLDQLIYYLDNSDLLK